MRRQAGYTKTDDSRENYHFVYLLSRDPPGSGQAMEDAFLTTSMTLAPYLFVPSLIPSLLTPAYHKCVYEMHSDRSLFLSLHDYMPGRPKFLLLLFYRSCTLIPNTCSGNHKVINPYHIKPINAGNACSFQHLFEMLESHRASIGNSQNNSFQSKSLNSLFWGGR